MFHWEQPEGLLPMKGQPQWKGNRWKGRAFDKQRWAEGIVHLELHFCLPPEQYESDIYFLLTGFGPCQLLCENAPPCWPPNLHLLCVGAANCVGFLEFLP